MRALASSSLPDLVPLAREWFTRDALVIARALIGMRLVVRGDKPGEAPSVGRIVETEAYCGPKDLACHAKVGVTERTKTLYGPSGHAYVFLIYGMYDCFNVVCGEGKGHAVLVRAVEPISGFSEGAATDGPGKLTRAMSITRKDNAQDLALATRVFIADRAPSDRAPKIGVTARVGVAYAGEWADRPWRFLDATSAHVSRPPAKSIGRPAPVEDRKAPKKSRRAG